MATATLERPEEITAAPATKSKLQQSIQESTEMLVAQLQAGKSEALTQYLTTMARFHTYSFCNQMLIARQKPSATYVAGFHKWLELHRYVRKGEKGIAILAPMITTKLQRDGKAAAAGDEETSKAGPRLIGFKVVYVFDVKQTEGEALAEYDKENVQGDPGEMTAQLIASMKGREIGVEWDPSIAPAQGCQFQNTIKLLPGQSPAEEFATLVHECAHALLHRGERRQQTTKTIRETEAEAVSFIVATAKGLQCGRSSSDYIQMYDGNTATLMESLHAIQGAASEILSGLDGEK